MDEIFESDAEPAPIPEIVIQSLNRFEENYTNSDGEIRLSEMRGDVIILDFMAHDCSNCHAVQAHLEANMDDWKETADANGVGFHIFGYGAWYLRIPRYNKRRVSFRCIQPDSAQQRAIQDGSTTDPKQLFTTAGSGQIPVVMVIDVEGYIVERQATGTPIGGWGISTQLSRTH